MVVLLQRARRRGKQRKRRKNGRTKRSGNLPQGSRRVPKLHSVHTDENRIEEEREKGRRERERGRDTDP